MDTITHAALGAAAGEAILGKQMGWRAALSGAIIANIPDLDLLAGLFTSQFDLLLIHRGVTHSLVFCLIAGAILGWALHQRFFWVNFQRLTWMSVICLLSHVLLDTFNSMGTQLFYPFRQDIISLGNIFVIDPLYTLPLLFCTALALTRKTRIWRKTWNNTGLVISCLYLILTFTNQAVAEAVFTNALHLQGKSAIRKRTHPTPLNNLIWYTVAESPGGFYVGFYDLRENNYDIPFQYIPRQNLLNKNISNPELITQMEWMTEGYLAFDSTATQLVCYDMRLGIPFQASESVSDDPEPVFSFEILDGGQRSSDIKPLKINLGLQRENLIRLWNHLR